MAGTVGATEPTWIVTRGGKTVDGGVTWMECTGMAGPNGDLTNCPQRLNSTGYTQGSVIYDSVSSSLQILTTASGNTAASAPTFSATAGATTADSANVWTSLGPVSSYTAFLYPHARLNNAFTATWGAAGNQFAVASNHAETQAALLNLANPGTAALPCGVYCISSTTTLVNPTLASTATITTTGANSIYINTLANSFMFMYGLNFYCGTGSTAIAQLYYGNVNGTAQGLYADSCSFNVISSYASSNISIGGYTSGGGDDIYDMRNCTFTFSNANQAIQLLQGYNILQNCVFCATGTIPTYLFFMGSVYNSRFILRDCDLSAVAGTLFNLGVTKGGQDIYVENCKLASGVAIAAGSNNAPGGPYLKLHNSDSAATNYRYYYSNFMATAQTETTIVRTGGATNGTTPQSLNITSSANAKFIQPFVTEDIAEWNTLTGSRTATFYLTSNTALDNSKIWAEVEYLGSASSPLGTATDTRMALLGTPTALTTDGSTWGGSTTYKYSIAVPITPQMAGIVKARVYVAQPSITVYVDPVIYIA